MDSEVREIETWIVDILSYGKTLGFQLGKLPRVPSAPITANVTLVHLLNYNPLSLN